MSDAPIESNADKAKCEICGEPMPPGEEMFRFHGMSGNCPKPPIVKSDTPITCPCCRHTNPERVCAHLVCSACNCRWLEERRKPDPRIAELTAEVAAMRPVVEAAVAFCAHRADGTFGEVVRAYTAAKKREATNAR